MTREPVGRGTSGGIDRRAFVGTMVAGAAAVAAGCSRSGERSTPLGGASAPRKTSDSFPLDEWTIAELQGAMHTGRLTSEEITSLYLERIAAMDRRGPELRAVIETNPDALAIARTRDRERTARRTRGPLHGIPILVKDNIDTADRMGTTAGSLALVGARPARDAFIVARLRDAGAVIIGKANLSEWANFRSTRSTSGWSARGGQCRNPYALERSPCGSSAGTGAGVSANFASVGIGTETDGSIVCPSSTCGIVGIKPTVGLASRAGIVPISHSQDTAGPMARTVTDAAVVLGAITGDDPRDPATTNADRLVSPDYTTFLKHEANGLQGARIGVYRAAMGFDDRVDAIMEESIVAMRDAGAEIVDPVENEALGKLDEPEFEVLLYEFKADMNAYLATASAPTGVRTLEDLIAFNESHAAQEMPYFGQELFLMAQEKGPLTDEAYVKALDECRRLSRGEGIDALMDQHRLDAIVAPTNGPAWRIDLVCGDHFGGGSSTAAAVSGYPSITVPAGFVFGLPIGISFFGRAWSEGTLIRLAYAFEQRVNARRAPGLEEAVTET